MNFLLESRWAIRPEVFEQIVNIAQGKGNQELAAELRARREEIAAARSAALFDLSVPGFEGKMYAGGVAVIPFMGPHFPRANMFTRVSGAVSLEKFRDEFTAALNDPKVRSIIMDVDSPGGNVTGTDETSQLVASAKGVKPVTAFISGVGASGAYWIASAASRIVMDQTAEAGSIGVQATFTDWSESDKKSGVQEITIVASQSPKKNMPVSTPEGRAEVQRIVDDLAQVMLERIAVNRGMDPTKAQSKLGEGAVFVAAQAVEMGLADSTSTFAELIRSESEKFKGKGFFMGVKTNVEEATAKLKTDHPEVYEAVHQEGYKAGKKAEGERLLSMEAVKKPGYEDFIATHKKDPEMTKEKLAFLVLEEEGKRTAAKGKALADDATAVLPAAKTQVIADGDKQAAASKKSAQVAAAIKAANSRNPAAAGKGRK
jgi:signal peptide peptidase SppA